MATPPIYKPTPLVMTTTGAATEYRLTTPLSSSPSSSSPAVRTWRRCALWLAVGGRWVLRRRYELAPAAGTTGLTLIGLPQNDLLTVLGADLTALPYSAAAVASAALAVGGLKYKNAPVTYAGAAGFVALADVATAVAAGASWWTVTAWALSTGAAYGAYVPWLTRRRHERMKLNVDTIKAKGAVPGAMGLDAADPGLTGATPEETALRRALHALVGVAPLSVDAFHYLTQGGWACIVTMPMGRNTSPQAIIGKRAQLEANLGMSGRLALTTTAAPNQLIVRLSTVDVLAGTIPYVDSGDRTCKVPVLLGADDEGREMRLPVLYRHTLVAGASDWGKSGIVNLLIARLALCVDAELYGIDMKPGAPELGPWASVMTVARNAVQARAMLEWVREECNRRGEILAELSRKSMAEGRGPVRKWVPGEHGKALFVFTDELAELGRQDAGLAELYESLLAIARFVGVQFISATQQPSRKVFGNSTDARGNYGNRLSTRQGEAGHAPFIFGQGCQSKGWRPEELDLPGKFLAQTPEHDDPRRVYRAQYVSNADIAAAVGFHYSDVRDTEPQPAITDEPWVEAFAPLRFPDGTDVGPNAWPELYRVFAEMGNATKKELSGACQVSRDTCMRALEHWTQHGVQGRKDGRSTRYYLPTEES